jgi:anthranilate synthase/aminodeoxychorismate synthase-like glutamine amidotransferase
MILMIDNYDSFTYNLVQMFEVMGETVRVWRNDQIDISSMDRLNHRAVVISPGPGAPGEAGVSKDAILHFGPKIPALGVCLGHQAIAEAFGGKVIGAERIMHGKTSMIHHDGHTIYEGLSNPFPATRYHSLIVDKVSLPDCFEISAWTNEGEIMGLRHREYEVEGVQFHPESILTQAGHRLIKNFMDKTREPVPDESIYQESLKGGFR